MQLTESGERFREYALKDVDDYYQVKKDILHIEQRQKKVVDLLSAYGILRLLTPDCIVAFQKKYPDIDFNYREYPDLPVEQLFAENEGNVAFSIGDFVFDDMYENALKLIPFSDGNYEWKACMITRQDEEENEGVQCFCRHVQEWLQKIRSGGIIR